MSTKRLYKYMRKEHARLLLDKGRLRIGTLYEYRNAELHGSAIGDREEGVKNLHLDGTGQHWDAGSIPEFAQTFFKLGPEANLTLDGVRLVVPQQSCDYFLFCTSSILDAATMHKMGYDACVVIEHPDRFFAAISHSFRHRGNFEGAYECHYGSRSIPHNQDNGVHPALIKEPAYAYQKEVRALWRPIKTSLAPQIIDCRKLIAWCSAGPGL